MRHKSTSQGTRVSSQLLQDHRARKHNQWDSEGLGSGWLQSWGYCKRNNEVLFATGWQPELHLFEQEKF